MNGSKYYQCVRCDIKYVLLGDFQRHRQNSEKHHFCFDCHPSVDFANEDSLEEHQRTYDHYECACCPLTFFNQSRRELHEVEVHNRCVECSRFFSSYSNLRAHSLTHASANVDCPCCDRCFITQSAMVLHLENGRCESGVTEETVWSLAFSCNRSARFTTTDRDNLECPECPSVFSYMSALLQHVESQACSANLQYHSPLGVFLRYMRSRL